MSKIIENIKTGNYEVVDNQGVSVTGHFTQCLEKEFADLEAKLAEKEKEIEKYRNANMIVLGRRGQGKKHLMQIKIKEIQNQKAIELLQELLQKTQPLNLMVKSGHYVNQKQVKVVFEDVIMQKISELKGKVEDVKDYKD